MIRFIYNLFWLLGLLFFLPGYIIKMFRRGNYRRKFGQRLGCYGRDVRARLAGTRSTWLHAVSVGEVAVALKLIEQLRARDRDSRFVLTTTTTTGFAFAEKKAPAFVEVIYTPLDFWPIMRRAFAVIRPHKIVLVEAEVWPNLVAFAHARKIPVALINARLSPRSEKRFRRFRFFVTPTFRHLDLVCVQNREDIERWSALGIARARIHLTGSIKYDPEISPLDPGRSARSLRDLGIAAARPVFFGGSTHRGEEEILARAFVKLRAEFPSLLLFIAPRHVERCREIQRQLEALSVSVRLVSDGARAENPDCILLDKTGELASWYRVATLVFVGKSLTARGGQNPVEPITAAVPVLFGPHMENFAALAKALIENGGALEVREADELERAAAKLLRDHDARQSLLQNAHAVLEPHRGATARTAQLVLDLK